jgi:hypothetical protein
MFKYSVKIRKVSGRLNESYLPSKSLVIKSKTEKTDKQVFAEASKYIKEKYGLEIESAEVIFEGFFDSIKKGFGKVKNAVGRGIDKVKGKFGGNKPQCQPLPSTLNLGEFKVDKSIVRSVQLGKNTQRSFSSLVNYMAYVPTEIASILSTLQKENEAFIKTQREGFMKNVVNCIYNKLSRLTSGWSMKDSATAYGRAYEVDKREGLITDSLEQGASAFEQLENFKTILTQNVQNFYNGEDKETALAVIGASFQYITFILKYITKFNAIMAKGASATRIKHFCEEFVTYADNYADAIRQQIPNM